MELNIVISFDEATKEIINNLINVMAAKTIKTLLPLEDKPVKEKEKKKEVSKKTETQPKEEKAVSDITELDTKDFVDALDEIDAKRTDAKGATIEDVRQTLATKKKQGYTAEIKKVLASFGVKMVSDVKPEDYDAVIQAVNEL